MDKTYLSKIDKIETKLEKIHDTVTRLEGAMKSMNEKLAKQNGRVTKLEEKTEKGLMEDVKLNTSFKEHAKKDEREFSNIHNELEVVRKTGEKNKTVVQDLKVTMKYWAGGLYIVNLLIVPVVLGLIVWYLTHS